MNSWKYSYSLILFCCLALVPIYAGTDTPSSGNESAYSEPNGILTLDDVLTLIVIRNPELSAYSFETRARDALILQSKLPPNPELEVMAEEFGGTGTVHGVQAAQTTLQINQLLESGSKRAKRTQVAQLDKELADLEYQAKRLELFCQATKLYADILAAQERIALAEELQKIASEVNYAVTQRIAAGKDSPLEKSRAEVGLSTSRLALEQARRDLSISRTRLASLWDSSNPQFTGLQGNIYSIQSHGSPDEFMTRLSDNPSVARWTTAIDQQRAITDLEKANARPDITFSVGTQYFAEPDDTGFVVGFSIPLPVWDRNQGQIMAACARLNAARAMAKQAEITAQTELITTCKSMQSAFDQSTLLRDTVIPASRQAFDACREGFNQGKFSYLDLLDSQRTWYQTQQQYLDILVLYHQTHADLKRLVGGNLDSSFVNH